MFSFQTIRITRITRIIRITRMPRSRQVPAGAARQRNPRRSRALSRTDVRGDVFDLEILPGIIIRFTSFTSTSIIPLSSRSRSPSGVFRLQIALTEDQLDCPVCQEKMVENVKVCGAKRHFVCDACVRGIMENGDGNMKCPVCRNTEPFQSVVNWSEKCAPFVRPCELGCGVLVHRDTQEAHLESCAAID